MGDDPAVLLSTTSRFAIVGHELDGSVAALRLITQVMKRAMDQGGDRTPECPRELHDALVAETERIAMLVDDVRVLRGIPRIHTITPRVFDLTRLVRLAGRYAKELQPDRPVTVELPVGPIHLLACPSRLGQLVRNLLDNALRYAPDSSPIELVLRPADDDVGWATISVIDHGPGVAPGDEERIFLPHVRGRSASGRRGQGLGLFLCRDIAYAMGGQLWYEPTPGGGATFVATIPLRLSDDADVAGTV